MNVTDQIKWEKDMVAFGIARFRGQQSAAVDRGAHTETSAGAKLLRSYLSQVSQHISEYATTSNRSKYGKLLRTVDADKIAMFSLTVIISAVYEEVSVARVVQKIGTMIEDDLRFTKFYLEQPEFFEHLERDMNNRKTGNYRYRQRVLNHAMKKSGIQWVKWDTTTLCGVGELVLRLTLSATDLVKKEVVQVGKYKQTVLTSTEEVDDWIKNSDEAIAVMLPDRMPCLIPPLDWEDELSGGYHTPRLRMTTPLVKTRQGISGKIHKDILSEVEMPKVYSAINAMQKTAWKINVPVLKAMQKIWDANLAIGMPPSQPYEVPKSPVINKNKKDMTKRETDLLEAWKMEARELYSMESKRKGLVLGVSRTMRIAEMLKDKEEFYYVYQCDFRGRVYCATSGVSPQGNDHSKAVLHFAKGKVLGKDGWKWLCVHGANKYGYDKENYEERVKWIEDNRENWIAVAEDPIGNRKFWKDADKPYQFLAFCIEFSEAVRGNPENYVSHLPIALDGSCNGLQHFSAILRDPIGGKAVNLTPSDKPSDVYQDVADVATKELKRLAQVNDEDGVGTCARNWLALFKKLGHDGMNRKLSKVPVMTLPYGSTQQACTSTIFKWYIEQEIDFFPEGTNFLHCIMLSKVLWASIAEVVVAARAAMAWIQDCSSVLAKQKQPMQYTSMLNFPVFQGTRKTLTKRIDSRVGGNRMTLSISTELEGLDTKKQRQGSSPNLVHHVDATHMMMCINSGVEKGIDSFAMIHDDFGVHACDIDTWHKIIRQEFINLHSTDLLEKFKQEQEQNSSVDVILPDLPEKGSLVLEEVKDSLYFFG